MNKNHEINRLTEAMELCLEGGSSELPADLLASNYAAECSDINRRLAMIATMIGSGGEMEALQVAEAEPRLVERAVMLSFGGEEDWREYCRNHGYELAPDIDVDILEALEKIYGRKISAKHPLYKEYRAAIRSRDETKAYELIKIITTLNPGDENSRRELERMEHKLVVKLLGELEQLKGGKDESALDESALFQCLKELEKTHRKKEYEDSPVYRDAIRRRREIRCNRAKAALPGELAATAKALEARGDWRNAAKIHAEASAKIDQYKIILTSEQQAIYQESGRKLDALRAEAERKAKINLATKGLLRIAEDVELAAMTPKGLAPEFAEQTLEGLLKYKKELKDLRTDLQAGDQTRVATTRTQLEQVLERRRKAKKARAITCLSLAAIFLMVAAVYGWLAMQAVDRVKLLVELQENGQSKALEQQVGSLRESDSVMLRFSNVTAQLAISDQWIKGVRSTAEQTSSVLDALEVEARTQFAGSGAEDIHKRMCELDDLAATLPGDMRNEFDARTTLVRNGVDRYLTRYQKIMANEATVILKDLDELLAGDKASAPAAQLGQDLHQGLARLEPYLLMSKHEAKELHLPDAIETRVNDTGARLSELLNRVDATLKARETVLNASSIEGFSSAIVGLAGLNFDYAQMAQQVLDAGLPNEDKIKAEIMFCGDMQALKTAEKMDLDTLLVPNLVSNKDLLVLSRLNNNVSLKNIHEVKSLKDGKKGPMLYSKEKLKSVRDRDGMIWSGQIVYPPSRRGKEPEFKKRYFRERDGLLIIGNALSATSSLIDDLMLDKVTGQDGADDRFKRSVISLVDVVHSSKAPTLAKAYVLNELFSLMRGRKYEWGLHILPSLMDDMRIANDLMQIYPLEASDWLYIDGADDDAKHARLKKEEGKWKGYFAERVAPKYFHQLRVRQSLFHKGLRSPIKLAGVVTEPGDTQLAESSAFRIILGFCLDDDGKRAKLRMLGQTEPGQDTLPLPDNILMLSPLYAMDISSIEEVQAVLKMHEIKK